MARYATEDGLVVDTDRMAEQWDEERDWDGHNHIGRSSRSQWHDQTLYRSKKGRYYLVTASRVQGERDGVVPVEAIEAARWLYLNEHDLPEDLQHLEEEITA
jgi:hypothetical protein